MRFLFSASSARPPRKWTHHTSTMTAAAAASACAAYVNGAAFTPSADAAIISLFFFSLCRADGGSARCIYPPPQAGLANTRWESERSVWRACVLPSRVFWPLWWVPTCRAADKTGKACVVSVRGWFDRKVSTFLLELTPVSLGAASHELTFLDAK
jgi:hypothetical protein